MIEIVQTFDRAPITALKTDDASALESKLSAAAGLFADRKSWLKPFERIAILHRLSVLPPDGWVACIQSVVCHNCYCPT